MTEKSETRLSYKDYRDLAIQSGLEFLPGIGPALSSAYFGRKQELRFKRIEGFYKGLGQEMEALKGHIMFKEINKDNREDIAIMIERLNDEIEKASQQLKKQFMINFFINYMDVKNTLSNSDSDLFFEMLSELNTRELYSLKSTYENGSTSGIVLSSDESRARIYRLVNYGLLEIEEANSRPSDSFQKMLNTSIRVTRLGSDFYKFCLYPN